MTVRLGPDASRYWLAAGGQPVARPFHLRWLLPAVCGQRIRAWWVVWACSWPLLAGGVFLMGSHLGWQRALLAAVLCVGLPGVWGPAVVRPVGVDLPAMALTAMGVGLAAHGWWAPAVLLVALAAGVKETAPLWAALWAWNPIFLTVYLTLIPIVVFAQPAIDQVTAQPHLREIHDHPIRTAWAAHAGRWRDAWLWVAPWGVCLAALREPTWPLAAILAVAHLQVLVATDTVRLTHTAAGPAVAVAAASVLPPGWLLMAAVAHVWWWRQPEVI